jgi:hypothetical protein
MSGNLSSIDNTQFFIGTPSKDEIKQYFLRQKRLADLKKLESSPEIESSPELSESFELYLQQRKKKIDDERLKILREAKGLPDQSPISSKQSSFANIDDTIAPSHDESVSEESFLEMEKMCEKTLHLNNESAQLMDLTSMNITNNRKSLAEESRLDCIEAPSFLSNSSLMSPGVRSSPRNVNNRPSTILEVSETTSNRTAMSSYKTARTTTTGSDVSYRTAGDLTNATDSTCQNSHISVDSLEPSRKSEVLIDLTKDSLNIDSSSDSGLNSGLFMNTTDHDDSEVPEFNDTLERIEYILRLNQEANAMKEDEKSAPVAAVADFDTTPKHGCLLDLPITPNNYVTSKLTPQQSKKKIGNRLTPKNSPLIKFSPAAGKSPASHHSPAAGAFKKPVSATKTPAPFLQISKKYQHIQSPIASYIKQTPGAPASFLAGKTITGITRIAKTPDFRDSESFAKENEPKSNYKLPHAAKTKTVTSTQLEKRGEFSRTPGGSQVKSLLTRAVPEVKIHAGHYQNPENINMTNLLNETNLSDQSFADLSLMSGNVSLQIIDSVKRAK